MQEDLLPRVIDIVETSGSGFAFPSQRTHVAPGAGLDGAKSKQVIANVPQWRGRSKVPFRDFLPARIAEMRDKLQCPALDSAVRKPSD